MTNLNVRFFSHFILGTYLVDIKLITSHFLPIFTLINIRTRVPFKIQVHLIINILRNCQTCKKEFSRKKTKKHHLRDNIHILNIHTIPTFHTEKGDHSACTTQENFTVDIWQQKSLR